MLESLRGYLNKKLIKTVYQVNIDYNVETSENIVAVSIRTKTSNISSVDVSDAPKNKESAPPRVFKKSQ